MKAFVWFLFLCLHLQLVPIVQAADLKIALNWKPEAEFGGYYAAQVGEIFKKHQLNVTLLPGGAGTPTVQMLGAGQVDFAIASADEVILAQSHHVPLVAIFATYQRNTQAILVHQERGFKKLADVFSSPGKLAMQKGLPYSLFLMKKFAGSREKMKVDIVPFLGGIQVFLLDPVYSQQCFVTSEPITAEQKSQKVQTFLIADSGFNPYTTVLVTRREVIEKKPALVKELQKAVREGHAAYLANPTKTNKTMNALNPSVDLETLEKSAAVQKPFIENAGAELGSMTESRWSELVSQLLEIGLIKAKMPTKDLFQN